jgi:hypothetical protein
VALVALVLVWPSGAARAHRFPAARTAVVQVEPASVALLVGYQPGSADSLASVLGSAMGAAGAERAGELAAVLTARALAGLTLRWNGQPLTAAALQHKLAVDPSSRRLGVLLLVTFPLPSGAGALEVQLASPVATRMSWEDRSAGRARRDRAPSPGRWFAQLATLSLELTAAAAARPGDELGRLLRPLLPWASAR